MLSNKQNHFEDSSGKDQLNLRDGFGLNYDKLKALSIRLQQLNEVNIGQITGFVTTKGQESLGQNTFTTMTLREIQVQQSHVGNGDDGNSSYVSDTDDKTQNSPAKPVANRIEDTKREEEPSSLSRLAERLIAPKKLTKGHCPCPDCDYWKKLYIGVLTEYEGFKAQSEFILESNLKASEQRVLLSLEETEKTRQTLEKEKFSLTSTCRDLNRGKIALECEIRTLRDELEETRRKLVCAEEKVTKECDFHQGTRKIDERNFKMRESDCQNVVHRTLQSALLAVQKKNQYLEDEVMEANRRNDQLTEEIKTIFSGHDAQVKDLKNLMHVYEEERREFEIKLAETQGVLDVQDNYMKKADAFIREREESQTLATEKLNKYSAELLEESYKTMLLLEQKLEKAQAQREDLTTSLSKAVQVIQKLKEQPKRCHNVVLDYCSEIYTIFSISPKGAPQRSNSSLKLDVFEDNATRFLHKRDSHKNCDQETCFEIILENLEKFLKELVHELEFWKKEIDENQKNQLKERITELERHLSTDKKNLLLELNSAKEKCSKYKHKIKNIRKNLAKYQIKRNQQRRRVTFMDTSDPPKSPRGSIKEVRQRPPSSPKYILHPQDITQLQKGHAKFSEILEHVDKYVSYSEGRDNHKEKRTIRSKHQLLD